MPLKREMVRELGVKAGKRGNGEVETGVSMGEESWRSMEWRKKWRTCSTISTWGVKEAKWGMGKWGNE